MGEVQTGFQDIQADCDMPKQVSLCTKSVSTIVRKASEHHPEIIELLFPALYAHANHENIPWIADHSYRVALLSQNIGSALGFSGEILSDIVVAGLLHDIGKTDIATSLLNDPHLTQDEIDSIRDSHVRHSVEICNKYGLYDIAEIIAAHHEYRDPGKSPAYPRHTTNKPFGQYNGTNRRRNEVLKAKRKAKIVLEVADLVDATLSAYDDHLKRPYQRYPERTENEAISRIQSIFTLKENPELFEGLSPAFITKIPKAISNATHHWKLIRNQPIPDVFIFPLQTVLVGSSM